MRKIIAYRNYYREFMLSLGEQERGKIKRALLLLETEDRLPFHYISYIREGLYEFRVTYGSKEFRLFFMWDEKEVVVFFNCYTKKTKKAPKREIEKALRLMEEYKNER